MKFVINAGHTKVGKGTGAVGYLNESNETRVVTKEVIHLLELLGHTVIDCTIDKSENYLKDAVLKANAANKNKDVDLAISIHFNSFSDNSANGCEVITYDKHEVPNKYATNINKYISKLGFKNRGNKVNNSLYWLKSTTAKAIIVECCFVSNKEDSAKYNPKSMAEAIVLGLIEKLSEKDVSESSNNLVSVCVGTFRERNNAEKLLKEVKERGYKDAFLLRR